MRLYASFTCRLDPRSTMSNIALLVARCCITTPPGHACSTSRRLSLNEAIRESAAAKRQRDSFCGYSCSQLVGFDISLTGEQSGAAAPAAPLPLPPLRLRAEDELLGGGLGGRTVAKLSCIATKPPSSASIIQ